MKILWLAHRDPLNPRAGGAERIIFEVGKRLAKGGNEVSILAGGWKNCKRMESLNGIHIMRFGYRFGPHLALPILLIRNSYDVIIADLGHAVPWISPVLLRRKTIVSFLHLHARSLPGQVGKVLSNIITAIEKLYFIIYHKQLFVTISTTSYNDLLRLGIKRNKITVINPGVNNELFKPSVKTEYPSMVYFGGMRPYKRPEESLYILKEIKKKIQNVKLTIIGEGISKSKMERLALELNIMDSVVFTGKISYEMISRLVSCAWLNIHSSITEGWGISITEAASSGTPTVAYEVPGVVDSIEDGKNGLKVKDGDRESFVKAVLSILTNPEKWWSSSVEVAQKYSWDKTTELWDSLIRNVITDQKEH